MSQSSTPTPDEDFSCAQCGNAQSRHQATNHSFMLSNEAFWALVRSELRDADAREQITAILGTYTAFDPVEAAAEAILDSGWLAEHDAEVAARVRGECRRSGWADEAQVGVHLCLCTLSRGHEGLHWCRDGCKREWAGGIGRG